MTSVDFSTLTLTTVLTAAGATATAAFISALVGLLKNFPAIGPLIDNGNEVVTSAILAAIVVAAAVAASGLSLTLPLIFGTIIAWYGIVELTSAVHDRAAGIAVTSTTTTPTSKVIPPTTPTV